MPRSNPSTATHPRPWWTRWDSNPDRLTDRSAPKSLCFEHGIEPRYNFSEVTSCFIDKSRLKSRFLRIFLLHLIDTTCYMDGFMTENELAHEFACAFNASQKVEGPQAMTDDDAAEIIEDLRKAGLIIEHSSVALVMPKSANVFRFDPEKAGEIEHVSIFGRT
jgi:hypothetical protein